MADLIISSKRRKTEDKITSRNRDSSSDQDGMTLIPVLPEDVTTPVPVVTVYAAAVLDKRITSKLLRHLSASNPLEGLSHVKRVRKQTTTDGGSGKGGLEIILCETSKVTAPDGLPEAFLEHILPDDISKDVMGRPFVASVAKTAPQTRLQFEEASRYWPTAFHEDKELAMIISGRLFSQADQENINKHMKEVTMMENSRNTKQNIITAVIVDPKTDVTLAKSVDCVDGGRNPLHHAVMKCIDLVAHSQGGGAWPVDPGDSFWPVGNQGNDGQDLPYLCTGYDLYVTQEPCIMCAMALVHSRIRRVFYHISHSEGALGSKYKLHAEPGINHRYQVFRVAFSDQDDRQTIGTLHPS